MRILLVNHHYRPNITGGSEISVMLLAEGLAALGHSISVMTIQPVGPADTKTINGVTVYYVPVNDLPGIRVVNSRDTKIKKLLWSCLDSYNLFNGPILKKVIQSARPDLVHTHNLSGFSVNTWREVKNHGLPIVHTLRDMYLVCLRSTMFCHGENCSRQCLSCRVYSYPKMIMARHVDYVIGISKYILNKHLENGFFKRTHSKVIYNSVPIDTTAIRKRSPGKIRFGYIGRLDQIKGIEHLIRSYREIATEQTELFIAGSGNEKYVTSLKALAGYRLDIRFLGFMDSGSFYDRVDLIVVPSKWEEPFGRVIIEAFGRGIPVIGARRGGIPEIISSQDGWLFNPDSEKELSSIMAHCLENFPEIEKMRAGIIEKARKYDLQASLDAHLSIYNGVRQKRNKGTSEPAAARPQARA